MRGYRFALLIVVILLLSSCSRANEGKGEVTASPSAAATAAVQASPSTFPAISIPALGITAPVKDVSWKPQLVEGKLVDVWDVPNDVVGHLHGTAWLGEAGNIVLTAHHNRGKKFFAGLDGLKKGDEIFLWDEAGKQYSYRVERKLILPETGVGEGERREHARYAAPGGEDRLTLISCWPSWSNTHRVVVIALPER